MRKGITVLGQGGAIAGTHVIKGTMEAFRSTYGNLNKAIDLLITQAEEIEIDTELIQAAKTTNGDLKKYVKSVYLIPNVTTDKATPLMDAYDSAKKIQTAMFVKIETLLEEVDRLQEGERTPEIDKAKKRLKNLLIPQKAEFDKDPGYDTTTEKFNDTTYTYKVFKEKIKLMNDTSMIEAYKKLNKLIHPQDNATPGPPANTAAGFASGLLSQLGRAASTAASPAASPAASTIPTAGPPS